MAFIIDGTTGIATVDGSVSAPSQRGQDNNTGISYAADTIKFSTGGVERISITNSGISGTGISAGGLFASYAVIADVKSSGTSGGTFTTGGWRTRDLNNEIADADGIVSISNNQFTLQAGTYLINARSAAYKVGNSVLKLYNVTDSTDVAFGNTGYSPSSEAVQFLLTLTTRLTISGAKVFELQMAGYTTENTYGMGVNHSFGSEIYTTIEIYKEN
tara:strand:- start:59 stop:706 length:648 start_codon:yes stop_codon:yes gene_type:complete